MQPWWPSYALQAWNELTAAERARARVLIARLTEKHRGVVLGQTAFVRELQRHHHQSYGPTVVLIHKLVRRALLRRKRKGRTTILWIPEHLLDESIPAHVDDLMPAAAPLD